MAVVKQQMTIGEAARAASIATWQLQALIRRGMVAEPRIRVGPFRVVDADMLPQIKAAAVLAGYLEPA
jgi:hypothetical protein